MVQIGLILLTYFFLRFYVFIFRERGREGEREREKHKCVVASHAFPTGDLACNPGMCPDRESNRQPFGSQARAQSTELGQPGLNLFFFNFRNFVSYKHWEVILEFCLHLCTVM